MAPFGGTFTKSWIVISASTIFFWVIFITTLPLLQRVRTHLDAGIFTHFRIPSIKVQNEDLFSAPMENIWVDLSPSEAESLLGFLFDSQELNLTKASNATSRDNVLLQMQLLQPSKTGALSYMNGTAERPARWARVKVSQGVTETALMVYYMVGPLPVDSTTRILPLEFPFNSGRNYIMNPQPDLIVLQSWIIELNISDVTQALLGSQIKQNLDPTGLFAYNTFTSIENGTAVQWVQFYRDVLSDGSTLLPQGLYFQMETSTREPKNWKLLRWYYDGTVYESITSLRHALSSPHFRRLPINLNGPWTEIDDFSPGHPHRQLPPPIMIQPLGPRYSIDKKESFISWMGFSFFLSTNPDTGLGLHKITFDNDSIIYELALQEALAHYAGDDPSRGSLQFLDTLFGMGLNMRELVPGYDCPSYATYLDTRNWMGEKRVDNKRSVCVFEYTADHVLQRHTAMIGFQATVGVSVSRNTYLVVRSVSTMGNYDYTIDYIFFLDGTIEVKVRASGYILGAFTNAGKENQFGYRIDKAAATAIHDHVLNFKADFDLLGTSNTFLKVGVEPVEIEFGWDDERTRPRQTMHLVEERFERELGIDWPKNSGGMFIVRNENEVNKWGEKRGYRIMPGTGVGTPSHLAIKKSTALGRAAEWAMKDLWVVRQKDTEPRSADPLNNLDPNDPIIDFSKFVDGDEIANEDLVVYFNLGSHHVPHSGDIPNTLMHTSASSIMLTPFNFHDRDPSRTRASGVKLKIESDFSEGAKPRYYGGRCVEDVDLKVVDLEPDLSGYEGQKEGVSNIAWLRNFAGIWNLFRE